MGAFPNTCIGFGSGLAFPNLIEPTDAGYGRQAIAFTPLGVGAPSTTTEDVSIGPAVAAWPPIMWVGLFDGFVDGNCLLVWPLTTPFMIAAGTSLAIPTGGLSLAFADPAGYLAAGVTAFDPGDVIATSGDGNPCTVTSPVTLDVTLAWPGISTAPSGTPVAPGGSTPTANAFSDAERTDIRRFCGYPAYGAGPSGFQSWRYFQAYGVLEYRLIHLSLAETSVVRTVYLAQLYPLEAAIPGAGSNLDTDRAAVWYHNRTEVADRARLFDDWRRRLAAFLGVPFAPGTQAAGAIVI